MLKIGPSPVSPVVSEKTQKLKTKNTILELAQVYFVKLILNQYNFVKKLPPNLIRWNFGINKVNGNKYKLEKFDFHLERNTP